MTIHLVKLCVGAETVDDMQDWVKRRTKYNKERGLGAVHDHVTRMFPKQKGDILDGGSMYWVIKGVILVRQKIIALEPVIDAEGIKRCMILLEPPLIETEAQPKRAFQGWRYFKTDEAPADLKNAGKGKGTKAPPAALRAELADLGLL